MKKSTYLIKRGLDIFMATVGLLLCSPFYVIIAVLIKLDSPGPILFRQQRPGLQGKPFIIYKFRTMSEGCDHRGCLLPDEQRITRIGRFLRNYSIDELPQLINVLKGEMSIVGPRPLLMEYLDRYSPEQARRHEVRPGMTGYAQVNGRNVLTWERRFKLDVWYVDHWSLWLDIKIIWATLSKAIRSEGISAKGYATMPEFMGSGRHEPR